MVSLTVSPATSSVGQAVTATVQLNGPAQTVHALTFAVRDASQANFDFGYQADYVFSGSQQTVTASRSFPSAGSYDIWVAYEQPAGTWHELAPTRTVTVTASNPGTMPAPPGYSHVIFDDNFGGTTLDASKWIPQIADQFGVWDNGGSLPPPLSASGAGQFDAEYFSPDAVKVNSGLTLVATRDQSQQGYTWKSGCITTHGKFTFQHGYAQFRVKMPDSTTGMWGGLWFLEGGAEIDLIETGYTNHGPVNSVMATNLHSPGNQQQMVDTGVDLSLDYHIYGMEYIPGQSVTMYLDGRQISRYTSSVPTGAMTILVDLQVAQNASGWHTVYNNTTASPSTMSVSEVQVWQ